jgi:hypothetical protein
MMITWVLTYRYNLYTFPLFYALDISPIITLNNIEWTIYRQQISKLFLLLTNILPIFFSG